jgi:hypothetical protein
MLMPWASKSAQHAVTLLMDLTRPVRLLLTYPWPQRQSQVIAALADTYRQTILDLLGGTHTGDQDTARAAGNEPR